MPILLLISYSLIYPSVIGLVLFFTAIVVMYKQRNDFWRNSSQSIGIITALTMLFIYAVQFTYFISQINPELIEWLGVKKVDQEKNVIYDQMVPLILILMGCSL
jgi:hypothetical protein